MRGPPCGSFIASIDSRRRARSLSLPMRLEDAHVIDGGQVDDSHAPRQRDVAGDAGPLGADGLLGDLDQHLLPLAAATLCWMGVLLEMRGGSVRRLPRPGSRPRATRRAMRRRAGLLHPDRRRRRRIRDQCSGFAPPLSRRSGPCRRASACRPAARRAADSQPGRPSAPWAADQKWGFRGGRGPGLRPGALPAASTNAADTADPRLSRAAAQARGSHRGWSPSSLGTPDHELLLTPAPSHREMGASPLSGPNSARSRPRLRRSALASTSGSRGGGLLWKASSTGVDQIFAGGAASTVSSGSSSSPAGSCKAPSSSAGVGDQRSPGRSMSTSLFVDVDFDLLGSLGLGGLGLGLGRRGAGLRGESSFFRRCFARRTRIARRAAATVAGDGPRVSGPGRIPSTWVEPARRADVDRRPACRAGTRLTLPR